MIQSPPRSKRLLVLMIGLVLAVSGLAQTTIVNYDFNSGTSYGTLSPALAGSITCSMGSTETFTSGTGISTGGSAFTANATAGNAVGMNNSSGTDTRYFTFQLGGSDLITYTSFKIYLQAKAASTGATTLKVAYSTDGTSYTNFGTTQSPTVGSFRECIFDLSSTVALNQQAAIYFKIMASGASGTGALVIDNFEVQAVRNTTCSPTVSVTNTPTLTCTNPTGVITTSTAVVGLTYLWAPGGATTSSLSVSSPGVYTVTARDPTNGCAKTKTVSVTSNTAVPTLSITNSPTITCSSPTVVITGTTTTAGATYSWSPGGATTSSVSVSSPNTYTLKVTDGTNGCTSTGTVAITTNTTAPTLTVAPNTPSITCTNTAVVITNTNTASSPGYTWSPGGANTSSISVSTGGTYTLLVKDGVNGCTISRTTVVATNTTAPTLSITNSPTITCSSPTVVITGTTTTSGATYSWSPGSASTSSISASSPNTYTLRVIGSNGCVSTSTISITSNTAAPTLSITNSPTITCSSPTVVITGTTTTSGATYSWSPGSASTSSISVSSPNTYTLRVIGTNGCVSTGTVAITTNTTPPTVSAGSNQTITITAPTATLTGSGTAGITYTWSPGGAHTSSMTASSAGIYTLAATNPTNGCTNTATVSVTYKFSLTGTTTDYQNDTTKGGISLSIGGGTSPYNIAWNGQKLYDNHTFYSQVITDISGVTVDTVALYHALDSMRAYPALGGLEPGLYSNRIYDANNDSLDVLGVVGGKTTWNTVAATTTTCTIPAATYNGTLVAHGPGSCLQQSGTYVRNGNYAVDLSMVNTNDFNNYVEFSIPSTSDTIYAGFKLADTVLHSPPDDMFKQPYIYFNAQSQAHLYCFNVDTLISTAANDVFGILFNRKNQTIDYYRNYQRVYSVSATGSRASLLVSPMQFKAVLNKPGAQVNNVAVVGSAMAFQGIALKNLTNVSCGSNSGKISVFAYSLINALCTFNVTGPNGFSYSGTVPSNGNIILSGLSGGVYTLNVPLYALGANPCATSPITTMAATYTVAYLPDWTNIQPTGTANYNVDPIDQSFSINGTHTPSAWDGGATSVNTLDADYAGWLDFKASFVGSSPLYLYNSKALAAGFNDLSGGASTQPSDIDHFFYVKPCVTVLTSPFSSPVLLGPFVVAVKSGNTLMVPGICYAGTLDVFKINKVLLSGSNMRLDFYKNSTLLPANSGTIARYDMMMDVSVDLSNVKVAAPHVSFGCKMPYQYALLKRKMDGGYYSAYDGKLYFKYDEEYDDTDRKLTFNIYNSANSVVLSNSTMAVAIQPSSIYGDNRYYIDLVASSLSSGFFILEVTNEKNEKWYLRFKN